MGNHTAGSQSSDHTPGFSCVHSHVCLQWVCAPHEPPLPCASCPRPRKLLQGGPPLEHQLRGCQLGAAHAGATSTTAASGVPTPCCISGAGPYSRLFLQQPLLPGRWLGSPCTTAPQPSHSHSGTLTFFLPTSKCPALGARHCSRHWGRSEGQAGTGPGPRACSVASPVATQTTHRGQETQGRGREKGPGGRDVWAEA